jgi:membrane protease YdiL (CAAX protease family)
MISAMTEIATPASIRPWLQITGFKFGWPMIPAVIASAVLMQGMLVPGRELGRWLWKSNPAVFHHQVWEFVCLAEVFQFLTGVVAVLLLRRFLPQAPTYLRWPKKASHWWLAAAMGLAFAAIMLMADFWPQLFLHKPFPDQGYEMTTVGVPGWLIAMLGAGPNEELVFRSFLVGLLTVFVPGRVRAGAFEVPLAAVVVGLLFAGAHYGSFFHAPLAMAIAQALYAAAFSVLYVWLMERANSVAAPMLTHGLSDAAETAATMLLTTWWR